MNQDLKSKTLLSEWVISQKQGKLIEASKIASLLSDSLIRWDWLTEEEKKHVSEKYPDIKPEEEDTSRKSKQRVVVMTLKYMVAAIRKITKDEHQDKWNDFSDDEKTKLVKFNFYMVFGMSPEEFMFKKGNNV